MGMIVLSGLQSSIDSYAKPAFLVELLFAVFCLISQQEMAFACESRPLVIMWQVPKSTSDNDMREMHDKGVNVIQHFQLTNWTDKEILAYLDRANQNRMSVLIYLGHVLGRPETANGKWDFGSNANAFVFKWHNHPAVYGWHTFDEPKEMKKIAYAKDQDEIYDKIKLVDSAHPVVVSTNLISDSDYKLFFSEKSFDILEMHAYPNGSDLQRQKDLIKSLEKHRNRKYPIWFTIRAFNGGSWVDLTSDSLQRQFALACQIKGIEGIGFYGWKLAPNKGITDVPSIMDKFSTLISVINKIGAD